MNARRTHYPDDVRQSRDGGRSPVALRPPDLAVALLGEAGAHPAAASWDPPTGHLHASAVWLIDRHPILARLAGRIPDAITAHLTGDGHLLDVDLDVDVLAQALTAYDAFLSEWTAYSTRHRAPRDEDAYDAWAAAGPHPSPGADAVRRLSTTERTRLRLLALFAPTERTHLAAHDLTGLDEAGRDLLTDACRALITH